MLAPVVRVPPPPLGPPPRLFLESAITKIMNMIKIINKTPIGKSLPEVLDCREPL